MNARVRRTSNTRTSRDRGDREATGDRRSDKHRRTPEPPRHVVITGAAGAIGSALAREMRAVWPEARLALVDRDVDSLHNISHELGGAETKNAQNGSRELGAKRAVTVHAVDLRELDALPRLVDEIEQYGPVDGLVNCAGVMRVQQLSTWQWQEAQDLLAIDLLAPLRLQDLVVRGMIERRSGFVINIASMAGRVPLRGCGYYGAAKAGLAMASEIARAELARHGVRVVTVYPGPVKSALEAGARAGYGGAGVVGRFAPTGDAMALAARIMHALDHDEPRVIYPRLYGVGWNAPNLSSWFALSYGPHPVN